MVFFPLSAPTSAEILARGLPLFWGVGLGALDGERRGQSLVRPGWVAPWAWSQRGCPPPTQHQAGPWAEAPLPGESELGG